VLALFPENNVEPVESFWFEISGIICLIGMVGFFSAGEVAVLSSRKSRMKELVEDGNDRAATILGFQENPERFLATVHVGVIFSLILASGLGGTVAFQHLVPWLEQDSTPWVHEGSGWIALALVAIVTGFFVVVFGELVPKSLALRSAEQVALAMAGSLRFFSVVFRAPAWILSLASNGVLFFFRDRTSFTESRISEEEFKLLLEEGTKSGVIDSTEQELIKSIFEFTDTTVKEVMIPRPDVVAVNVELPRDRMIRTVVEEGYSRMPVYRGSVDNILGVVYTKDLLGLREHGELIILHDLIRPAFYVPETRKISSLMRDLQKNRMHMAIVVDEFGGFQGIVTMEDILEEIVGEIHDEYDEVVRDVEQSGDGSFLVNARMGIRDFNERFQTDVPIAPEYDTISGFVQKLAGRIGEVGEETVFDDLQFTIVKKSQRRIRLVRFKRLSAGVPRSNGA
jgi:putative hemolysin